MYQSVIDKLNIDIEDLLTINDNQLIKFEKILKSQLVLNNESFNAEDNNTIIEVLKDPDLRKFIYIIEKHPKLKSFLTNGKPLESKTLTVGLDLIENLKIDHLTFQKYLEPYLQSLLIPKLKDAVNENKFFFVLDKIKNDWLFTEDIKFQCQKLLLNKISVTTHLLNKSQKLKELKYTKDKGFVALLKESSYGANFEYLKNYVETLAKQLKIGHPRTKRATFFYEALIAVKEAKTGYDVIDEFIDMHTQAHLARSILKKKSPEEWAQQIGITAMLFSVIVIIALVINASKNDVNVISYTQKDTIKYYEAFERLYGSQMTNDAMGVLKSIEAKLILKAYQYPYTIENNLSQPLFYPFYESFPEVDLTNQKSITIENLDNNKSVIVFRKNTYNHCTILKPQEQLTTFIEPKDSLIFYRGNQLHINDFSTPLDPLNGIFKVSSKTDRKEFFQVYIVDSLHNSKHAKVSLKTIGKIDFQGVNVNKKTTSYVGKNFIDVRLLDSYLD